MRIRLEQRLEWLENGHEGDPAYTYNRAKQMLGMTMGRYFSGRPKAFDDLKKHLQETDKPLEEMTYGEVILLIHERCHSEGAHQKCGFEALWALALPFIGEALRRRKQH